jgi:enamine deaminase RidA (YjgF/YER057c/UK114 family)
MSCFLKSACAPSFRGTLFRQVGYVSGKSFSRFVHIENRLEEFGIELPTAPTPKANYNIVCHASGNMMYVSGHLPIMADGTLITGRIGPKSGGESIDHGYKASRQCGLNIISTLKKQLGDLDRVHQIVKVRWILLRK